MSTETYHHFQPGLEGYSNVSRPIYRLTRYPLHRERDATPNYCTSLLCDIAGQPSWASGLLISRTVSVLVPFAQELLVH